MSKWIPCSERMPEDEQDVLITIVPKVEVHQVAFFENSVWHAMYHNDPDDLGVGFYVWGNPNSGPELDEVIAWMPLPKPYTEDTP
jgi:hypothetical protein